MKIKTYACIHALFVPSLNLDKIILLNKRWNMLSEQYFKSTTWPSVENIESMIPNGVF